MSFKTAIIGGADGANCSVHVGHWLHTFAGRRFHDLVFMGTLEAQEGQVVRQSLMNFVHRHDETCAITPVGLGRPPTPWCIRFAGRIRYQGDCWIWIPADGKKDSERNRLTFSTRSASLQALGFPNCMDACRWIYARVVGPIPDGLELDHAVCENWRCVNPAHLEPVTTLENNQRYRKTRASWTIRDERGIIRGRKEVVS